MCQFLEQGHAVACHLIWKLRPVLRGEPSAARSTRGSPRGRGGIDRAPQFTFIHRFPKGFDEAGCQADPGSMNAVSTGGVASVDQCGGGEIPGCSHTWDMFRFVLWFRAAFFVDGSAGDGRMDLEGVIGGVVLGDEYAVPAFQGSGYQLVDGVGELVVSALGPADGDVEA